MRQALKADLPESHELETNAVSAGSNESGKFSLVQNKSGQTMLQYNGVNRHERRANSAYQRKTMRKLMKSIRAHAAKEQAKVKQSDILPTVNPLAAQVPQAPETVPNEG